MSGDSADDFLDLSELDEERLALIFRERRGDLCFLNRLDEELDRRTSDEALDLRDLVLDARRVLVRPATLRAGGLGAPQPGPVHEPGNRPKVPVERLQAQPSGPVRQWLQAFLGARRLGAPDGRPLYRYRMADSEYDRAKNVLRHLAERGRLAHPDDRAGALFVAYCAEWFRRESSSTFLRWDEPAPDLFPSVPYGSKQSLTDLGLRYWGRVLRRSEHSREFLLTVALEGGFPVRILVDGARGWLKDYLRAIMRRALSWRVDTQDEIRAIAEEERGRMRKSYQHDDFVALCSELVEKLLHLRQEAEAAGAAGVRNSALLDARHPGWRDALPIHVPAEDEALATELLSGLLDEKMVGLATEGVEARRYLVKQDGRWRPATQLLADGEVAQARLPLAPGSSRVRAIPTGELGNHLSGEVALLEPPVGGQQRWRVRPFTRTARLLVGFPFAAAVTTTLTSPDSLPHPWTWPRGEALRSDVLVFRQDEGSTPQEPLLRFLRAGSVSASAKVLHVLVPEDWGVEPAAENAVAETESLPAMGRKLVRLVGAAYFRGGDNDGTRFRVEPDTEGRERELDLAPPARPGFTLADQDWELVGAPARPLIREIRAQPRSPGNGELHVRWPGGKWTPLTGPLDGSGFIELSWRDPVANIQIEKRRLVLVPGDARVSGMMTNALDGQLRLEGLAGWTASVADASCAVDTNDGSTLAIRFTGRPIYHLPIRLRPPAGGAIEAILPLIGRESVIALADGSIVRPGARVDVRQLRGAAAISPRRATLHLSAKSFRSGGVRASVEGELPLGVLRSAIEETFAMASGQDDLVELEFIGDTRLPIRISRYGADRLTVDPDRPGALRWRAQSGMSGVRPVVRMVLDPHHEHTLEPRAEDLWHIPERCRGVCLVYLRDDVDVVSRPISVTLPGAPNKFSGNLISALETPDYEQRQHEIAAALAGLGRGEREGGDLGWLLDATTNLNGLPPSAVDALRLLASIPEALIRLLLNARDMAERGIVWSLQTELPFHWLALPVSDWQAALLGQYSTLATAFEGVFGKEEAAVKALEWLDRLRADLVGVEPALQAIFDLVGRPAAGVVLPSLRDLTSRYVAAQHHRGGEARNEIGTWLASRGLRLPPEIQAKSHEDFAGLFAPVLLAASAREKLEVERDMALLVRRTFREDPAYVSSAWCHLLKFYGSA